MAELVTPYAEWYAAADDHDTVRLAEIVTPDCELVAPGANLRGPEQIARWVQVFFDAFPDLNHPISTAVLSGDTLAVELRLKGTHTGPLLSPQGTVPPTKQAIDLREANVLTCSGERIASVHMYFDQVEFLTQVGLMPASG